MGYYAVLFVILLIWTVCFTIWGVKLCKKNNAFGLIPLFLGLFLLGLVIGAAILYNNKKKEPEENQELSNS